MAKSKGLLEKKPMEHKPKPKKGESKKSKVAETAEVEKADSTVEKASSNGSKINWGKCCRCTFRNKEKICRSAKSPNKGKHVPRKSGCGNFKSK